MQTHRAHLKLHINGLSLEKFFNTSGLLYKSLEFKTKLPTMTEEEMLKLLAIDDMALKIPILAGSDSVLVGFKETEWESTVSK